VDAVANPDQPAEPVRAVEMQNTDSC